MLAARQSVPIRHGERSHREQRCSPKDEGASHGAAARDIAGTAMGAAMAQLSAALAVGWPTSQPARSESVENVPSGSGNSTVWAVAPAVQNTEPERRPLVHFHASVKATRSAPTEVTCGGKRNRRWTSNNAASVGSVAKVHSGPRAAQRPWDVALPYPAEHSRRYSEEYGPWSTRRGASQRAPP